MTALGKYDLTASSDVSQNALGQEINVDGATYRYVQASTAITAFQICVIELTGTIQPLTTALAASVGPVAGCCIPQFAMAANEYGYAPVGPFFLREDGVTTFKVSALTLNAARSKQYTTATAGAVDDAVTTLINGLTLTTTVGGATANTACQAHSRILVGGS
jgi:hypothetical protein